MDDRLNQGISTVMYVWRRGAGTSVPYEGMNNRLLDGIAQGTQPQPRREGLLRW
jgi:hypothetical protein